MMGALYCYIGVGIGRRINPKYEKMSLGFGVGVPPMIQRFCMRNRYWNMVIPSRQVPPMLEGIPKGLKELTWK